jgi:hypothetical protein
MRSKFGNHKSLIQDIKHEDTVCILLSWRWRQYVSPTFLYPFTNLYCVTIDRTVNSIRFLIFLLVAPNVCERFVEALLRLISILGNLSDGLCCDIKASIMNNRAQDTKNGREVDKLWYLTVYYCDVISVHFRSNLSSHMLAPYIL